MVAALAVAGLLLLGVVTTVPVRGGSHAVEFIDFAFSPATLTIGVGETVTWTNADQVVDTATSGAFDSGDLDTSESYSVTFSEPGTYDYLCTPHPDMIGRIIVEAAPAGTPSSPPTTGSGSGSLPDVAMAPPGPSALQVVGIGLLILSALAAGVIGWSRRTR